MTQSQQMSILWIDDDGERRFSYELKRLAKEGWEVTWARGVADAVSALSTHVFFAILLDKTLPMTELRDRANVWQGCLLLHWLRGKPFPSQAPEIQEWERIKRQEPRPENRSANLILVSAYIDSEVDAAFLDIEPDLVSVIKPIDSTVLIKELKNIREKQTHAP